jgi:hypothetical protein
MIIYGTTGIRSTMKKGEFYCPHCKEPRTYRHRKLVKWATLYFIPIFPMERVAEYIECDHCVSPYEVSVLDYDPNAETEFLKSYTLAFAIALHQVVESGGIPTGEKMQAAFEQYTQFMGREVEKNELAELFHFIENNPQDSFIGQVASGLNDEGKKIILKAAIEVAFANVGKPNKEEINAISSVAEKLGVPEDLFKQLVIDRKNIKQPA